MNYDIQFLIFLFFSGVLFAWYLIRLQINQKKKREQKEKEFVNKLITALSNESVEVIADVKDLYYGFFDKEAHAASNLEQLGRILAKTKYELSQKSTVDSENRKKQIYLLSSLIEDEKDIVKEAIARIPFSGVPSEERTVLEDLREITGAKTNVHIQTKLEDLAKLITSRQSTIEKLSDEKGESLKWAKWGVLGTVFFSLSSIYLGVKSLGWIG